MINEIFKKYGTKLSFHDNRKADENVLEQAIKETARVVLDRFDNIQVPHNGCVPTTCDCVSDSIKELDTLISEIRKEVE